MGFVMPFLLADTKPEIDANLAVKNAVVHHTGARQTIQGPVGPLGRIFVQNETGGSIIRIEPKGIFVLFELVALVVVV